MAAVPQESERIGSATVSSPIQAVEVEVAAVGPDNADVHTILPGAQEAEVVVLSSQDTTDLEDLSLGTKGEAEVPHSVISFSLWDILKKSAINLVLPFINGVMLGFGEILAHEIGFRYNFVGARVQPPRRLQKKQDSRYL